MIYLKPYSVYLRGTLGFGLDHGLERHKGSEFRVMLGVRGFRVLFQIIGIILGQWKRKWKLLLSYGGHLDDDFSQPFLWP